MKNKKTILLLIILFLAALLITTYPLLSNKLYAVNSTKVQTEFFQAVEQLEDEEIQAARAAAESYNALLAKASAPASAMNSSTLRRSNMMSF